MQIIKKPKFGRGTGINPCIDCKIFMFKKAKEYADKNNIKIIATSTSAYGKYFAVKIAKKSTIFELPKMLCSI